MKGIDTKGKGHYEREKCKGLAAGFRVAVRLDTDSVGFEVNGSKEGETLLDS
jgi:hypothetical protein